MPKITVKIDGKEQKADKGSAIASIMPQNSNAIAAKIDGVVVDLSTKLENDCSVRLLTFNDKEGLSVFRHSSAHILAHAVIELYPDAKLTIGPVVDEGFYYDIDMPALNPDDLKKIEQKMHEIMKKNEAFVRKEVTAAEAKEIFKGNPYKLELIDEYKDVNLSIYYEGKFADLCVGPHVPSAGIIKAFKLTKVAGAYWRGVSANKQLQRIYGISFPSKEQLDSYLKMIEEAEKRDHRKLGKEMELFSIHDESPGCPFFLPNGMAIINILKDYWRKVHKEAGYVEVSTPIILNKALWVRSGHWENYRENMYLTKVDNIDFAIKPMNCPGGMLIYKEKIHSYKDLPLKMGEMGIVHRHELSGVLSGLFRVRCFTQDDAHIFMEPEQIKEQIIGVIKLTDMVYKLFGFTYNVELSTRPKKSVGTDEQWEAATLGLKGALDEMGIKYKINEGDGAFYGPKIDFHLKDAIGRTWQCGTIQLDMANPERFDLTYEGKDGKKHRPVMIHRVVYGSMERFLGILIEHFAGKFPLWIAPVQVMLLTIANKFDSYAEDVRKKLEQNGIRVVTDYRSESMSKKVRDAQLRRIPFIITIGEKEVQQQSLAIRTLDGKVKFGVGINELILNMIENIKERKIMIEL